MNARLDPVHHAWMRDPATRAVMVALKANGGAARFVGGAVRNALLREPVLDIDIATPLVPGEVIERVKAAGLGAAPTGIAHGTVTVVADGRPFEVTTLRRDVETFGRRATVAFSLDWREDAARRDFTMNALYADEDGAIHDYWDGVADLNARRVRFVGDARMRIREDYLRALRLFRFHAWYGAGDIDQQALAAASDEKAGLQSLSGERVQKEMLRLLGAKTPMPALNAMQASGILREVLPAEAALDILRRLLERDAGAGAASPPVLRLAALLSREPAAARAVAARWKLSNADRDRLRDALAADERIGAALTPADAARLLYRFGKERFLDQAMLAWAKSGAGADDPGWRALEREARFYAPPEFPLDGRDAMTAGFTEGPEIGAILKEIEESWIAEGFTPSREALLQRLRERAQEP